MEGRGDTKTVLHRSYKWGEPTLKISIQDFRFYLDLNTDLTQVGNSQLSQWKGRLLYILQILVSYGTRLNWGVGRDMGRQCCTNLSSRRRLACQENQQLKSDILLGFEHQTFWFQWGKNISATRVDAGYKSIILTVQPQNCNRCFCHL